MPRFYFHLTDGETHHDEVGQELEGLEAVKKAAVKISSEIIGSMRGAHFWAGVPWKLWVTNRPDGEGDTSLTLQLTGTAPRRKTL